MKEHVGKELDIVDSKTQRYIATVKFLGMNDASDDYPLNCIVLDKFKVCGINFNEDNFISFDKDGFWRGKNHPQANEFDMRLVIPQKGKSQNVKDILVEAYAEGIIDVVHDVEKALKLVMPHLESGKLTLEMLNRVIRRAYES
ncbi:Phage protein [Escherichia phage VpaE1_ev035]|uniref:Phage protein n=1 Tax=Escherichia phage VpaE1_ev035 TaxID=2695839 RepID=A0A653G7H9_9CAUD|nr:Phage protein [Escherichia phage VpaE1_ev035]